MRGAKQRVRTCCSACASLLDAALDWAPPSQIQSDKQSHSFGFAPASTAFLGILLLLMLLRLLQLRLRLVLLVLLAAVGILLLPVFLALSLGFILALASTWTLSRRGKTTKHIDNLRKIHAHRAFTLGSLRLFSGSLLLLMFLSFRLFSGLLLHLFS